MLVLFPIGLLTAGAGAYNGSPEAFFLGLALAAFGIVLDLWHA